MTRTTRLALAALLALAACQSIVDPDKIKPTPPASLQAACADLTARFSDKISTCLGILPEYLATTSSGPPCPIWTNAEQKGRMAYVPGNALACLNLVSAFGCQAILGPAFDSATQVCRDAFAGRVAASGSCGDDFECQKGSYCSFAASSCPGTCTRYANQGEVCSSTQCAPGLYCNTAVPPTCQAWSPPVGLGGRCAGPGTYCDEGLYCDSGTGNCAARPGVGGACTAAGAPPCLVGLDCIGGVCARPKLPGAACTPGAGECVRGAFCFILGPSQTCVRYPTPASPVTACGSLSGQAENVDCIDGYCKIAAAATSGNCTSFIPVGQACDPTSSSRQCGPDASCPSPAPLPPVCTSSLCILP